jgi:hypothetical protein
MRVKRREILAAVVLGLALILVAYYFSMVDETAYKPFYGEGNLSGWDLFAKSLGSYAQGSQQRYQIITETIEGELERGAFENVVDSITVLVDHKGGYVKSLHMTYVDGAWSGQLICKLPPENVTTFTFRVREIIDANGTVTYINISVEEMEAQQQSQEANYSTIYINLKERKPQNRNEIPAPIASVINILSKGLLLVAQGVMVGVPMYLASLSVVLLINRGLLPIWRSLLKKPKGTASVERTAHHS